MTLYYSDYSRRDGLTITPPNAWRVSYAFITATTRLWRVCTWTMGYECPTNMNSVGLTQVNVEVKQLVHLSAKQETLSFGIWGWYDCIVLERHHVCHHFSTNNQWNIVQEITNAVVHVRFVRLFGNYRIRPPRGGGRITVGYVKNNR